MRRSHIALIVTSVLALVSLNVSPALAADFHGQIDNPTQDIPSVSTYQTNGADMAGMEVTALFSAGAPETVIWMATGATSGGAFGGDGDWSLQEDGDTFSNPWTLSYSTAAGPGGKGTLVGLMLDGFAAGPGIGVMFDRTFDGMFGTPGSFLGWDYETLAPVPSFDSFVTYVGAVGVGGAAPVGDEFRWLNVRFRNLPTLVGEFDTTAPRLAGLDGINSTALQFRQDTNNPVVPEPATLALLAAGAVGGLWLRRRGRVA